MFPSFRDALENRAKSRPPVSVIRGPISPAEKGLQLGRQEDRHRPTAAARRRLDVGHVRAVHVRPLFPVQLDGNKMPVQDFSNGGVGKRFALHDVAPVAGVVADGKEDGLVFAPRLFECLLTPGEPIHGVRRVKEQIRTFFADQAVRRVRRLTDWRHCIFGIFRIHRHGCIGPNIRSEAARKRRSGNNLIPGSVPGDFLALLQGKIADPGSSRGLEANLN